MLNVLDAYAPCPCGSGKKFKWCCQPIHAEIARAFQLDEQGQHETALRTMDAIVAQHADNPEAWGRKAWLLFQNEKPEEAEQALEKALALNPQYAFGLFLRGRFRYFEGEIPGALILFRKAIELYGSDSTSVLAQIYLDVFDCEMKLNHPIAAHAAAELAVRLQPGNDKVRQGIATVFGPSNANLPAIAKEAYSYKPLPAAAAAERRGAWEKALSTAHTGKLGDAARAFGQLTRDDPQDAAAWYNLGLTQAWLGNNRDAVAALEEYVARAAEEEQGAHAWALAEVLRLGQGMEDEADIIEHSVVIPLQDPQKFVGFLETLEKEGTLVGVQVNEEEGMLMALLLEEPPPALTPELAARQSPKLAAYLVLMGNILRLWHTQREPLEHIVAKLRQRAGTLMGQVHAARGPAKFHDILSEVLVFPRHAGSEEAAQEQLRAAIERFFEEQWLQRPLKSLGGVPPVDAAGHPILRKKLVGIVLFLQQCAELANLPYDFERLRRKLGLLAGMPAEVPAAGQRADLAALGAAELAGLPVEQLTESELEQAFQTAMRLDARELAGQFATALVARPPQAERPDRFALYHHLVQQALAQGDTSGALDLLNAGESYDCSHNEGRRRNDYELRRGQLLARSGDVGQAQEVFERLIQRVPSELRYRSTAAETMLSARQASTALRFAQEGLAEAVKQNNRDSAEHFKELVAAAQR
jgi:tetratricopeptide (TPR) repeat protein